MHDPDKKIGCQTCIHAGRNGCTLFKTSADVWDNCLAGDLTLIIPKGWTQPMTEHVYTFWKSDKVDTFLQPKVKLILPDKLFEI